MHLLLALDGSKESMEALDFVTRLPFTKKPKISLITALTDIITDEVALPLQEVEKEKAQENLGKAQAMLEPLGYVTDQIIEYGHPSRLIMDKGKELDVDLIVMGARGHNAAYRVILGSTANFAANHARCPVLVVRPSAKPAARDRDFNILLAYDDSPQSRLAYEQMIGFDWPEKTTNITLGMFFEKPHLLSDEEVYDSESLAAANKTLAVMRAKASCKCPMTQVVRETKHIGDALRDLVETEETDLLFLGDTGKSAIARFFLGSISRHLLHHVKSSIWIARKKEWN